jgi:predicted RNA-binding protein with PIN domain
MAAWEYLVVDGHNVLHQIPFLRKQLFRHPRRARLVLVRWLQAYQDFSGVKVRVAFDGRRGASEFQMPGGVEVCYAEEHQTADALIERAVSAYAHPQNIAVVTDDGPLRACVTGAGAVWLSPESLEAECFATLGRELSDYAGHSDL